MIALPEPFNWFPNPLTNRPSHPLWYTVCSTVYSFDFRTWKMGEETRSFYTANVKRAPPDEEESQVTWIQAPHWPLGYLWSSVVFEDPFCVSGRLQKWGGRLRQQRDADEPGWAERGGCSESRFPSLNAPWCSLLPADWRYSVNRSWWPSISSE